MISSPRRKDEVVGRYDIAKGGLGWIVLDTGHPDSPTLTIPDCIAIVP
jgi:hypothetical protein